MAKERGEKIVATNRRARHEYAIEKTYEGRQPITYAMLTLEGREALKEHWDRLERIRKGARALKTLKVT